MSVVRQALEKALLQDNENFWAANPPDPNAMDQQDPFRRNKLAMQFFLRLHILVACKGGVLSPHPCCNDSLIHTFEGSHAQESPASKASLAVSAKL